MSSRRRSSSGSFFITVLVSWSAAEFWELLHVCCYDYPVLSARCQMKGILFPLFPPRDVVDEMDSEMDQMVTEVNEVTNISDQPPPRSGVLLQRTRNDQLPPRSRSGLLQRTRSVQLPRRSGLLQRTRSVQLPRRSGLQRSAPQRPLLPGAKRPNDAAASVPTKNPRLRRAVPRGNANGKLAPRLLPTESSPKKHGVKRGPRSLRRGPPASRPKPPKKDE